MELTTTFSGWWSGLLAWARRLQRTAEFVQLARPMDGEDLGGRVVTAVQRLGHRDVYGQEVFPQTVDVVLRVRRGSPEAVSRIVSSDDFQREVERRLRNDLVRASREALPQLSYRVEAGDRDEVLASAGAAQGGLVLWLPEPEADCPWRWRERVLQLHDERSAWRLGRGDWHGRDRKVPNDLALPGSASFVARACLRLRRRGARLELKPEAGEETYVQVRGRSGLLRQPEPYSGWTRLQPGDSIQLLGDDERERMELSLLGVDEVDALTATERPARRIG
jgi:hypothetical protein